MTTVTAADVRSCRAVFEQMNELTAGGGVIRNFHADIAMLDHVVETELFPYPALAAYSAWNLELPVSDEQRRTYFSAHRGGNQGDYRGGMRDKVANVVDCLTRFPASKRAVISVVPRPDGSHTDDGLAKCLREVYVHLDGEMLDATVVMRAQAAEIFPKNIHFVGELMAEIAGRLDRRVGTLHYLAVVLVSERW